MPHPQPIGTVLELWRFPVKSMRGESLTEARLTPEGLEGDRTFALHSTAAPTGKPLLAGAERTAVLRYTAQLQPSPAVTTPDGLTLPLPSPELLDVLQTVGRAGAQLGLALGSHHPFVEDRFIGQTLRFGDVHGPQLRILERIPRCRIVSLDPETTVADPTLLRHLAQHHEGRIGIYARVEKPGILRAGDSVWQQLPS